MQELQESTVDPDTAMEIAPEAVAAADSAAACAASVQVEETGRRSWRGFSLAGVLLSLAFHGGVLAAGLAWAKSESGAVKELSEAISVAMTLTSVIEAADDSPSPDTAASDATAAAREGNSLATETAAVPATEIEAAPPPAAEVAVVDPEAVAVPPPQGLEVIEGSHEGGEAAGHASGDPQPVDPPKASKETPSEDAKPKRETAKPPKPERDQSKDKQRTAALQEGGVTAKARSGSVASSGRVSASKGDLVGYKARVNARVAGNKPAGSGGRGTATVSFGVSSSGGLTYARLSRSSGSAALDSAAVAAVRRSGPFGPTPTGGALSFSFSFFFR
jgi:protein TonB